jgi:YfiH family protein
VRFVGRGAPQQREGALASVAPDGLELAWARQVHSARVLPASAGACGEGDALWTARPGLALCVATADCVPVVLAAPACVAAVHAGWRGLAAGVIAATVTAMGLAPAALTAWLGPAIGPCCYEVGPEVAAAVRAASGGGVVRPGAEGRPHIDLPGAAARQLAAAGVRRIRPAKECTRCAGDRLWSYRGQGPGAGRNLAFVWLQRAAA